MILQLFVRTQVHGADDDGLFAETAYYTHISIEMIVLSRHFLPVQIEKLSTE